MPSELVLKASEPSKLALKTIVPSELALKATVPSKLATKATVPSELARKVTEYTGHESQTPSTGFRHPSSKEVWRSARLAVFRLNSATVSGCAARATGQVNSSYCTQGR